MSQPQDYPCPECGFEGPHSWVTAEGDVQVFECGDCVAEFSIPDHYAEPTHEEVS